MHSQWVTEVLCSMWKNLLLFTFHSPSCLHPLDMISTEQLHVTLGANHSFFVSIELLSLALVWRHCYAFGKQKPYTYQFTANAIYYSTDRCLKRNKINVLLSVPLLSTSLTGRRSTVDESRVKEIKWKHRKRKAANMMHTCQSDISSVGQVTLKQY